jgi:hypothetical protein
MFVYMYVYICVCVYIHTYIYTYKMNASTHSLFIYTYIYMYISLSVGDSAENEGPRIPRQKQIRTVQGRWHWPSQVHTLLHKTSPVQGQVTSRPRHVNVAGSTDEWKAEFKDRKTPNWDTRHWMSNFGSMPTLTKGTPTHNLFTTLRSDTLFTILPGEYHRVKDYLLSQRYLSPDEI